MNRLTRYISSQFKNPRGVGGIVISIVQNVVNKRLYQATVSMVNMSADEKLLDIGYGNGHLLKLLYKKQPADMYGIDISDDAKEMAGKRNKKALRRNQLHLSVDDCCKLHYEADLFDAVTSINTVYFWEDTVRGLSEIRRVLKNGSSFYNVVFTKEYLNTIRYTQTGYKKFEPEELVHAGEAAGFEKIEIREITKGKSYAVVYTK